jgi:hypothetical protein
MLAVTSYPQEFVDQTRTRLAAQVDAYTAAAPTGPALEAAFFNNLVIVLDRCFVHRVRNAEGKDGNPLNEARVICNSLVENGGVMAADNTIKLKPDQSLLGYTPGDEIKLDAAAFQRLAEGFLAEIERRYPAA